MYHQFLSVRCSGVYWLVRCSDVYWFVCTQVCTPLGEPVHQQFLSVRCSGVYWFVCSQVCLHPEVSQYVSSVCQSVRYLLIQGAVRRVDVVLIAPSSEPLERFVFDISQASSDTG